MAKDYRQIARVKALMRGLVGRRNGDSGIGKSQDRGTALQFTMPSITNHDSSRTSLAISKEWFSATSLPFASHFGLLS
jgi:hypothetical protein